MKIRKLMGRKKSRKAELPTVILLTVLLAACGPKTSEGDAAADTKTQGDAAADTKAQDSPQEAAETALQAGTETESASAGEGEATSDSSCDSFQSGRSRYGWWRGTNKYTKEDYEQILSWQTAGYENSSVAEFNRMVMDWEDEETFHKAEEVSSVFIPLWRIRIRLRILYMVLFPIPGTNVKESITESVRDRKIHGTAEKLFWKLMEMCSGIKNSCLEAMRIIPMITGFRRNRR